MREKRYLVSAVALACALGAANASASLVTISGGSPIVTPASNDVLHGGVSLLDNASIAVEADTLLSYYFVGAESGYTNTLVTDAGNTFADNNTIPGFPGTLLFSETYDGAGAVVKFTSSGFAGTVLPGAGDGLKSIAFAYLDANFNVTNVATNRILFAFDDSGAGPDDNHDDFVGVLEVSRVPLPGALWLFGTALAGIATLSRRRKIAS